MSLEFYLHVLYVWVKDSWNQETLSFGHSFSPLRKLGLTYSGLNLYLLIYFLEKLWVMQNVKCNHTALDSQLSVKLVSARFLTRNFMEFNSLESPSRSTYVAFSWMSFASLSSRTKVSQISCLLFRTSNSFSWFIVEKCSRLILWWPRI